jgi:hypothetical protein
MAATTPCSSLMASHLLPLLSCPLCPPPSTLTAPVTLFCGHTVCAKHVSVPVPMNIPSSSQSRPDFPVRLLRLTPCPLNGCTASPATPTPPPNIPSSSRVTFYYSAGGLQQDHDAAAFATIPGSRTDTTINKVAFIIHRHDQQQQAQSTPRLPAPDSGSGSDSQTDEEILDSQDPSPTHIAGEASSSSSIPRQVSSDGSQPGPARRNARKRRRKQLLPPRRLDAPAHSADQFEKDLLTELTCEICSDLLYQPVTSPCQHVRLSLTLSRLSAVDRLSFPQTFCSRCLHRSLDHSNQCPLCRYDLPGFSYFQDHPFNKMIISIGTPLRSVPVTMPHARNPQSPKLFQKPTRNVGA